MKPFKTKIANDDIEVSKLVKTELTKNTKISEKPKTVTKPTDLQVKEATCQAKIFEQPEITETQKKSFKKTYRNS